MAPFILALSTAPETLMARPGFGHARFSPYYPPPDYRPNLTEPQAFREALRPPAHG